MKYELEFNLQQGEILICEGLEFNMTDIVPSMITYAITRVRKNIVRLPCVPFTHIVRCTPTLRIIYQYYMMLYIYLIYS